MTRLVRWAPGSILSLGAVLSLGLTSQRALDLREPLDQAVPQVLAGVPGQGVQVSEAEALVAGFDQYVLRTHGTDASDAFSVYVGYYKSQTKGHTIHSPKNCMPGAGWDAISSTEDQVTTLDGKSVTVNRYVLQRGKERALVLYWYQGRGRVAHDEYRVKWDLLRDSALKRRSDEALVRIVVPFTESEPDAAARALQVAAQMVPAVDRALPL